MSRLISGQRRITYENLKDIAKGLNVPVSLLTGEQEPGWADPDIQDFFERLYPRLVPELKSPIRNVIDAVRVHAERCPVAVMVRE